MTNNNQNPVIIGSPKLTDELNPDLQQTNFVNPAIYNNIFNQDYMPLLTSMRDVIEALDHNVNYLDKKTKMVNRKLNLTIILFLILLLIIFFK